jgi:Protein of unknown function (DUF3072)
MMTDNRPMTAEQAATLKRLAKCAYELDAFKPNLTRAEADNRIAALTAKLKRAAAYALRSSQQHLLGSIRRPLNVLPRKRTLMGGRQMPAKRHNQNSPTAK